VQAIVAVAPYIVVEDSLEVAVDKIAAVVVAADIEVADIAVALVVQEVLEDHHHHHHVDVVVYM
jgi:hypothetical protein